MQAPARPIRLRAACDACSTAKVKCSQSRPACERCVNNGLYCIYGVSRRHGKQSSQKHQIDPTVGVPSAPTQVANGSMLGADRGSISSISSHDTVAPGTANREGTANPLNWLHDGFDMPFHADDSVFPFLHQPTSSTLPHSLSETPHCKSQDLGFPQIASWDETFPENTFSSLDMNSSEECGKYKHDCEAQGIEILQSLHHCPTDFMFGQKATNSTALPSPDKLFRANKTALSRLKDLFECPCARNPPLALLYVSILSKAMFWYRVMACANYWRPGTPNSEISGSSGGKSMNSIHSRGLDMHPAKVQLGDFDLDEDDQATLQYNILLRELRKAERVLENLTVLDRAHASEYDYEHDRAIEWYGLAIPKLKQELQAAIQETKYRQCT